MINCLKCEIQVTYHNIAYTDSSPQNDLCFVYICIFLGFLFNFHLLIVSVASVVAVVNLCAFDFNLQPILS